MVCNVVVTVLVLLCNVFKLLSFPNHPSATRINKKKSSLENECVICHAICEPIVQLIEHRIVRC